MALKPLKLFLHSNTMKHTNNRLLVLALFLVTFSSYGATIAPAQRPSGKPASGITIEGPIEVGDYEKFASLVLHSEQVDGPGPIWLGSPGGNLVEALKIGRLVRKLKLTVWAPEWKSRPLMRLSRPEHNLCTSSCFFIYVAGVQRFGKILGVHRPFLSQQDYERITLDEAAGAHTNVQEITSAYLRDMGVSQKITEKVLSTRSEQITWLSDEESEQLGGLIPEYQEWFKSRCIPKETLIEPFKSMAYEDCQFHLLKNEQKQAFEEYWKKATLKKYSK